MGLFGRDDRTQPSPQPAAAQPTQPDAQPRGGRQGHRTVITDKILVEGTVSGNGQIVVDGRVRGSINGKDEVTIAARGRVDAAVHGRVVMVAGRVKGDITADDRIELEPTAQVDGDITAPRILIKDGANFRGKVNMGATPANPEAATSDGRSGSAKPDQS